MKKLTTVLLLTLPLAFMVGCTKKTTEGDTIIEEGDTIINGGEQLFPEDFLINSDNYIAVATTFGASGITDGTFVEGLRVPTFVDSSGLSASTGGTVSGTYSTVCTGGGSINYTIVASTTGTTNSFTLNACSMDGITVNGIINVEQQFTSNDIKLTRATFSQLNGTTPFTSTVSGELFTLNGTLEKLYINGDATSVDIDGTLTLSAGGISASVSDYHMVRTVTGDTDINALEGSASFPSIGSVTFTEDDGVIKVTSAILTDTTSNVRISGANTILRGSDKPLTGAAVAVDDDQCFPLIDGTLPCVKEINLIHGDFAAQLALNAAITAKGNADLALINAEFALADAQATVILLEGSVADWDQDITDSNIALTTAIAARSAETVGTPAYIAAAAEVTLIREMIIEDTATRAAVQVQLDAAIANFNATESAVIAAQMAVGDAIDVQVTLLQFVAI